MKKLMEIRKQYGYTIIKMSELTGLSPTYYWQIENKKRRLYYKVAIKIAKVFNMKPDDIFYEN